MGWIYLILAGIAEAIWANTLILVRGTQCMLALAITVICLLASFCFLYMASKTIPIALAYAVWAGIGILGVFILNIILFKVTITKIQTVFVTLIIIGIVGLKLYSKK